MKTRIKEAGDMIASAPYNPNREPANTAAFGDMIAAELSLRLHKGQLSPVVYNKALDYTRRIEKQLEGIYGRQSRGLATAVAFVINKVK